jgi:transposase
VRVFCHRGLPLTAGRHFVDHLVRLTTAFNRILQLPGASVRSVAFTDRGIVIGLRRRRRRLVCPCSRATTARYDTSRRRWRHLDFGACQVWLEADIHGLDCRSCGRVRTEQMPWARPGARHTTDFENVVAQRADETSMPSRRDWRRRRFIVRAGQERLDDQHSTRSAP